MMRALTLWPEWLWAIQYLGKRVENRTWEPPKEFVGERIALHAGAHIGGRAGRGSTFSGLRSLAHMASLNGWGCMLGDELDYMSFLPTIGGNGRRPVDMYLQEDGQELSAGCHRMVKGAIIATAKIDRIGSGDQCAWGVPGLVHWHLSDLVFLSDPIEMRGKQKLWKLDAEVVDVLNRIEEKDGNVH